MPIKDGRRFAPVMGIVAIMLAIVVCMGMLGVFGTFGEPSVLKRNYILLCLLCGECGLQNAAITSASGATVRTTHLTGLLTDLGLGLVRAEIHSKSRAQREQDRKSNYLRMGTIFSFISGAAVGAVLFSKLQFAGFLMPMGIAMHFSRVGKKTSGQARKPT